MNDLSAIVLVFVALSSVLNALNISRLQRRIERLEAEK